ncbi:MAG: hypothetical protein ACR2P5_09650 [Gammaproteobacteria bacterium]
MIPAFLLRETFPAAKTRGGKAAHSEIFRQFRGGFLPPPPYITTYYRFWKKYERLNNYY